MKKVNSDSSNNSIIEEYINETKKKLPGYDININNVNDFNKMLEEQENCNKCKDKNCCLNTQKGFYVDYVNNSFTFSRCKYMAFDRNSCVTNYYLPEKLLSASLEDYEINTDSRKKIYDYVKKLILDMKDGQPVKGLHIYGGFSIGKTYTLAVISSMLCDNNIKHIIAYFPDLATKLRSDYYSDKDSYEDLINDLKSTKVLLLDDFGSENMTEWLRDEVLGPIINYRMSMNLPVFITSNVEPKELKAHLAIDKNPDSNAKAERIVNRLQSLMNSKCMDDGKKYSR